MKSETDFFVRFLCVGEFHQFHPLLFKQINIHTFLALGVMSVTTVWSQCENVKKKKRLKGWMRWGEDNKDKDEDEDRWEDDWPTDYFAQSWVL
jgi:hypothetical protein